MWQSASASHCNNRRRSFLGAGNVEQAGAMLTSPALGCTCGMEHAVNDTSPSSDGKRVGSVRVYLRSSTSVASHARGEACISHHLLAQETRAPEEHETAAAAASALEARRGAERWDLADKPDSRKERREKQRREAFQQALGVQPHYFLSLPQQAVSGTNCSPIS